MENGKEIILTTHSLYVFCDRIRMLSNKEESLGDARKAPLKSLGKPIQSSKIKSDRSSMPCAEINPLIFLSDSRLIKIASSLAAALQDEYEDTSECQTKVNSSDVFISLLQKDK